MAAAIPLATMAISAYMSHRAQKSAEKRSKEEQQALQPLQEQQTMLGQQGANAIGQGLSMQQGPANYYRTLLTGNRAAMAQAVAPTAAAITETYRGAESNLERAGVRGAAKDVAEADLGRQRASQLAGLVTGVQPAAAAELANLGQNRASMGATLTGQSVGVGENLLQSGMRNRMYARDEGAQAGAAWGQMIADAAAAYGGSGWGWGRSSPTLPARQTTPNWTSWTPPRGGGL